MHLSDITGTQFAQINAEMGNPGAPGTIYTSTDAKDNHITLSFIPTQDANLTAATPCPPDKAAQASGSLLYIDLSPMGLTKQELEAMTFTADGWAAEVYSDAQTVCFAPTNDTTIQSGAGNGQSFKLTGFTISNPPSSGSANLTASYYRIDDFTVGTLPGVTTFKVLFQAPPDRHDGDLQDVIALSLNRQIVITSPKAGSPLDNDLTMAFGPGSQQATVTAGPNTRFVVSFVYAKDQDGYGALCTPSEAVNFDLNGGLNADKWTITPDKDQQNPSWMLQPPTGKPIIGSGVQAVVNFDFSNIITKFRSGPTLMYVSYSGVPGYKDGSFVKLLFKAPHVTIDSFTVTPERSTLQDGSAEVTLKWQTENAGTISISGIGQDLTGKTSCKAPITRTTYFTLTAQGTEGANLGNVAVANVTAYVDPVVNSFDITPQSIEVNDFPDNVSLSWNVNTNGNVGLSSSLTGKDPNIYGKQGNITKSVTGPQMFTLQPDGAEGPWDNCLAQVSAFTPEASQVTLGGTGNGVAIPPNAGFVAVALGSQDQVVFISSVTGKTIGTGGAPVGKTPKGLAFSPDGKHLFVANKDDGTVSVIEVTATQSTTPYTFSVVKTVNVGGAPQQIAVSPDGKDVYVTVQQNGDGIGLLAVLSGTGNFGVQTTVSVGHRPIGVAVSNSGGQIFIANSLDQSITQIVKIGDSFRVSDTLENLPGTPAMLAITPDNTQLLVTIQNKNVVIGVSVNTFSSSLQTSYPVGDTPFGIDTFPGGGYALVANKEGASLTLLRTVATPGDQPQPGQTITLPKRPSYVAVGPSDSIAYASGTDLNVIELARYQASDQQVACESALTNVVLSPDNSTAVTWSRKDTHGSGLIAANLSAKVTTPYLSGTRPFDFAYSSSDPDTGYMCSAGSSDIAVLDTANFTTRESVAIPNKGQYTNRQPIAIRVSGMGDQVFVLVSDGDNQFSIVVIDASSATITDDVVMFTQRAKGNVFLALCPDGSKAVAVSSIDVKAWVLKRGTGGRYSVDSASIALGGVSVNAVAMSPDGATLYAVGQQQITFQITTVDMAKQTAKITDLNETTFEIDLTGLTVSPDGKWLFASDQTLVGLHMIDADSLRFLQTITWGSGVSGPMAIAVSNDGANVYLANQTSANLAIAEQTQK